MIDEKENCNVFGKLTEKILITDLTTDMCNHELFIQLLLLCIDKTSDKVVEIKAFCFEEIEESEEDVVSF